MSHLVVHFEIHASEPARLIEFYSELFEWKFTRYGEMEYWAIETGEGSAQMGTPGFGVNGGLARRRGPAPEPEGPMKGANLVVGVDDVDGTFARALELGGAEAVRPDDLATVGRLAYVLDPDNNVIGFISPILSDGTNAMA